MTTTEIKPYIERVLQRHPLWRVYRWMPGSFYIYCCQSAEYKFPTPGGRTYYCELQMGKDESMSDAIRDDYHCMVVENAMMCIIDRIEREWDEGVHNGPATHSQLGA